jgi:hypothetical protein
MANQEKLYPWALTTTSRVKDMLGKQGMDMDVLIARLVNAATDFIEAECNGRRFGLTQYVNEQSSTYGARQRTLTLRQCPVFYLQFTGSTTAGSNQVTNCVATPVWGAGAGSSIAAIQPGMVIQGGDNGASVATPSYAVPQGSLVTVTAVSGSTITMSAAATLSLTGANFTVHGLCNVQYRAGTPSAPSWNNFIIDQYELQNNGQSGVVRVYGVIPRLYANMVRATYWAGYVIDFDNFGNPALHALPASLTYLCEKLVVRFVTRRTFAGKVSEGLQGATTTWKDALDKDDQLILSQFRRTPASF